MEVMSTVSKDEKDKKSNNSVFIQNAVFDIFKQLFDDKIIWFLAFVFVRNIMTVIQV